MPYEPIITKLPGNENLSGFKAILLYKLLKRENYIAETDKRNFLAKAKKKIKVSYTFSDFADLESFSEKEKVILKIWFQKDYRSTLRLEYESKIPEKESFADYTVVNLFSRKFDRFQNPAIDDFRLILNIDKFSDGKVLVSK